MENFYNLYKRARNASWEILLRYGIDELPFSVSKLAATMGIEVFTYRDAQGLIDSLGLHEHALRNEGFTLSIDDQCYIFFNDLHKDNNRIRFTLAHEVGHLVCGHQFISLGKARVTRQNDGDLDTRHPEEYKANIFAARLLAPACVLWALGIRTAGDIESLCHLHPPAAKFRCKRMDVLYKREKEWIEGYGFSPFLRSARERALYNQFKPWIDRVRAARGLPNAGRAQIP